VNTTPHRFRTTRRQLERLANVCLEEASAEQGITVSASNRTRNMPDTRPSRQQMTYLYGTKTSPLRGARPATGASYPAAMVSMAAMVSRESRRAFSIAATTQRSARHTMT
jgi:hypothetical protein